MFHNFVKRIKKYHYRSLFQNYDLYKGDKVIMTKLITVQQAKNKVKELQEYIDLVENYQADTLDKWIIKEYGYTNSFTEIVQRANVKGFTVNKNPINKEYVKSVIVGKASDPLHKKLKAAYKTRIKNIKKGQYGY